MQTRVTTAAWARGRLGRVIQEHIKQPLADEVLFGKLKKGGTVKVSVETDEDGLHLEAIEDQPVKPKKPAAKRKPAPGKAKAAKQPASAPARRSLVPKLPLVD